MSNLAHQRMTEADYLDFERSSECKHEFYDGQIFAMAGASVAHIKISANILVSLAGELKGKPCFPLGSDMRVKVEATGLYTYPDVVVVCSEPKLADSHQDTLLNPKVVFEVLSPSTEKYDRGNKAEHYRQVPTLTDYFLVAQDRPHVEHYRRAMNGEWTFSEVRGLDGGIQIESISAHFRMVEVYANVAFGESIPLREPVDDPM